MQLLSTTVLHYVMCVVCEVVIQLESSNRWPCDITALQGMITLYYTQLNRILTSKHSLTCTPTRDYIDINKVCNINN